MKKRKIFLGLAIAGAAIFGLAACNETPAASSSGTQVVQQYTVTFSDGGTVVSTVSVDAGSKVTKPADPVKAEDAFATYVFAGWFSDEAMTQEFDFEQTIDAPTALFAKYYAVSKETRIMMNGTAYETIAEALAAIPTDSTETFTISLPKGTYTENGLGYNGSATVVIKGNTATKYGADVIIKGHGSDMSTEKTRNLIEIQGTGNIILENLTLESDWTRTLAGGNNAQAEVLGTDTKGNTVAYNCGFKSHQDTLRTAGKAWFYGCYIEGDVDFIWMEQAGSVALYENCEIVSVYDETASSHASYVAAPRMAKSMKVGKGLVIMNSSIKETAEAKENNQATYLARNPWSAQTDYYNQVAYINVNVEDIEEKIWYNNQTATEFEKTAIGYKMDQATANKLGYEGNGDILTADQTTKEYGGREAIINRVFNTGKLRFEKDETNYWNLKQLIELNHWTVKKDTSKSTLDGEVTATPTIYKFDGSQELTALTIEGFAAHSSGSYAGGNGATITVPVTGKGYVEVYGFYSGTAEVTAQDQGTQIMFFNNNSTGSEVENDYVVYNASATSVTITAKATTYITKIVVQPDSTVADSKVSSIEISGNTKNYCVGVPLTLSAKVGPGTAINKSILWSSSDETVGTINPYNGKVTFLKAGEVTFTATAQDGSNTSQSITVNPIEAKWVAAEWYTTDNTLGEETGSTEIGVFDTGGSAQKDFKINNVTTNFSFTNLAGQTISTAKGLKLNSAGSLSFSTTKGNATLTVITIKAINNTATPKVSDGTNEAALLSMTDNTAEGTITYVYDIATAGAWKISRGDETKECNPILYAKVVYDLTISKNTFVNYKGGTYHAENSDAKSYNHNNESASKVESTNKITFDNITYEGAISNGNDNWLKINNGATISFEAKSKCTLKLYMYNGVNNTTVTLDGTEVTTATAAQTSHAVPYVYEITAGGKVVITSTANNTYVGCFEVIFAPAPSTSRNVTITFGNDSNIDDVEGVAYTATLRKNGSNSQVKEGTITLTVKAGAKVTVYGYGGATGTNNGDYTAYTVTANGTTSETQNKDYEVTVAADGDVVITPTDGNNYLMSIKVEYPTA